MIYFTSSHHAPLREYRITDPGAHQRLGTCEYLRDSDWRPAINGATRHIAHVLAHGACHASLTASARARVRKLAALCTLGTDLSGR